MKRFVKVFALILCFVMVMTTSVFAAGEDPSAVIDDVQTVSREEAGSADLLTADAKESEPSEDNAGSEEAYPDTDAGAEDILETVDPSDSDNAGTDPENETENAFGENGEAKESAADETETQDETDAKQGTDEEAGAGNDDPAGAEETAEDEAGKEDNAGAAGDEASEAENTDTGADTEREDTDNTDPEKNADTDSTDPGRTDDANSSDPEKNTKADSSSSDDNKITSEETGKTGDPDKKETDADTDNNKTVTAAETVNTSLTIRSSNANFGRCTYAVTGVPKNASKVKIAVWCSPDKSDKRWYRASLQSDGTYTATMYKYLHGDHTGTYQAKAYYYLADGSSVYAGKRSFTVNDPSPVLAVTPKDGGFGFKARYIQNASRVSYVQFAIWSKNGGQDDLKWYTGTYSKKNVSAYLTNSLSKHKDSGTYYVHAYAFMNSGESVFIAGSTFNVQKTGVLSSSGVKVGTSTKTGKFKITVQGLTGPKAIKKVSMAVWNRSDKSDKVWYTADHPSSGTYSVTGYIKNHGYHTGKYTARIKVFYKDGTAEYLSYAYFSMNVSSGSLSVGSGSDETTYPVTLKTLTVPGGTQNVRMAVWSEANGQDDIVWYSMTGTNGGDYKAVLNIGNHRTAGVYNVHIYYLSKAGEDIFLKAATFSVNPTASLNVKVTGRSDGDSCFRSTFSVASSSSACVLTKTAVWCSEDMSDIVWYPIKANSKGNYILNINTANHYGSRGKYHFSVYARFGNGIEKIVKSFSRVFEPESYIIVAKSSGTCERIVKYVNGNVSSVKFRVWTEKGGTQDEHIYRAKINKYGTFYATVDMDHFQCDGKYYIQVLNGSTVLDSGSFLMIDYLEEAIKYAKNDSIGYSQIRRNLDPDVDCSSLVYYSLKNTGYTVPGYAFSTHTMISDLQKAGFTLMNYTNVTDLQAGDILLRDGHTEIYAGNGLTAGAHQDEDGDILGAQGGDQNGLEVCVAAIVENWQYAFRLRTYTS